MTRVLWQILGAVAELQRSLIREATISGMREAKRRGAAIGRPHALDELGVKTARTMHAGGATAAEVGRALGVSERTVRRVVAGQDAE